MNKKHKGLLKDGWLFYDFLNSPELVKCYQFLKEEREAGKIIYPFQKSIWRAFNYFDPKDLKVVILGQDPYHTSGTANGLAFATGRQGYIPPSLRNILKKIQEEGVGDDALLTHALTTKASSRVWGKRQADQGVLLLNTALTVEKDSAGSHTAIWKPVTDLIIQEIMQKHDNIVWVLWGTHAIDLYEECLEKAATDNNHIAVKSTHPSPFAADRASSKAGSFNETEIFTKVNQHLKDLGKEKINW